MKGSPDEEWKWCDGEEEEPVKNLDRAYIRAAGLGGFSNENVTSCTGVNRKSRCETTGCPLKGASYERATEYENYS